MGGGVGGRPTNGGNCLETGWFAFSLGFLNMSFHDTRESLMTLLDPFWSIA